ncbi:hypothetical protein [Telmatospirillum sp. J64-1]|uniref:hypothetical protein n=1 Tax=Telmatospirillum sp. J64-1 TaxID=2502183 RepID=UPI00115D6BB9|nr:hypothetical protein [Telmatospirillum sp. J64-1]
MSLPPFPEVPDETAHELALRASKAIAAELAWTLESCPGKSDTSQWLIMRVLALLEMHAQKRTECHYRIPGLTERIVEECHGCATACHGRLFSRQLGLEIAGLMKAYEEMSRNSLEE